MPQTTRRRFIQLASTATVAGLAGCSAGAYPVPTADSTRTPDDVSGAADEAVEIGLVTDNKGSYFQPKGLLVEPGTTLRFVNESGVHTATAYHPDNGDFPRRIPEGATPFDSGILSDAGAAFEVTVETPGVYDLVCVPHESLGMVGRLVVGEVDEGGPASSAPTELPPLARETLPSVEDILANGTVDGP